MVTIRAHHDADGITSALFTSYGVPESEIEIQPTGKDFGDTSGLTKDDWMVDMRPTNPEWAGTCIDHHFPHPKDRKYKLIPEIPDEYVHLARDIVPATYISWNEFKDKIPKSEWFKICIGLGGDGALEMVPKEVFDECPMLLHNVKTSAYQSYGKWNINTFPLYSLLSSCINAFLRKGDYETAIYVMKFCQSPMELYNLPDVQIAKKDVANDYKTCIVNSEMYEFGNLVVILFDSKYRMSGYVASSVMDSFRGKTIMAINNKTGSISLRGKLAPYYKYKLSELDYINLDGHCYDDTTEVLTDDGFKLFKDVTTNDIIYTLNPKTYNIEPMKPVDVIKQEYNGEMIHFYGRDVDLMVTPNHKIPYISDWKYKHTDDKSIRFKLAKDLKYYDRVPAGNGKWKGITKFDKKFASFLGWYIAEGWTSKKGNSYRISLTQSKKANYDNWNEIKSLLSEYSDNIYYQEEKSTFSFTENKIIGPYVYEKCGHKAWDKKIPKELKYQSPDIIDVFLDAYCRGDGSFTEFGRTYTTSSKQLADDLCELILKIGKRPSVKVEDNIGREFTIRNGTYETKHLTYVINENSTTFLRLGDKNKDTVDYDGMIYCVEMPENHIIYVRRNGKCIWSGNSEFMGGKLHKNPSVFIDDLAKLL